MKMRQWKKRMTTHDRLSLAVLLRRAMRFRLRPTAFDREADMREFYAERCREVAKG
jgi:hypothetical protein